MSFKSLLPLLLLVPAVSFADSDRNFKVAPNFFKEGAVLDASSELAIEKGKNVGLSEAPKVPLRANTFYYRQKKGPKEYCWYAGQLNTKVFSKLHAFSLKDNYLKASEVVTMRFYATQKNKAFQDENDIYFDKNYIYSPRVPKLFFMKNGRWQQLKETDLPGVITIDTTAVKDLKIIPITSKFKNPSARIYPVEPGMFAFQFDAPGRLPYVEAVTVQEGEVVNIQPQMPVEDTVASAKVAPLSVTLASVEKAADLEEVEALYDAFTKEIEKSVSQVDTTDFAKTYPAIKSPLKLSMTKDDDNYIEYARRFQIVRTNAKDQWRNNKMGGAGAVGKAIHRKLDSLEAFPIRGTMVATKVEPVYDESNPERPVVAARVFFGNERERFDVAWNGTVEGWPAAEFVNMVQNGGDVKFYLTLENNKPVWLYNQGALLGRFQYRYEKLEMDVNGIAVKCQGKFELPAYIRDQAEVQEWLNRSVDNEREQTVKSVVDAEDAAAAEAAARTAENELGVDVKMNVPRIVRDREHGSVALIDSGTFRYYGRVVTMSPFAIQTNEVTQLQFRDVMMKLEKDKQLKDNSIFVDPNKPVHNITWDNARAYCKMIGGDLPTEAQWEFAGRADNNEGALWNLDENPDPSQYAVFRDNSYKMGKKSSAYGPQAVGSKKPNPWGIYDMSGNVAEWTRDNYFMFSFWVESANPTGAAMGLHKVYKGGSWKDKESRLNLTERDDEDPRYWSDAIGFRCVFDRSVFEGKKAVEPAKAEPAPTAAPQKTEAKKVEDQKVEPKKAEENAKK